MSLYQGRGAWWRLLVRLLDYVSPWFQKLWVVAWVEEAPVCGISSFHESSWVLWPLGSNPYKAFPQGLVSSFFLCPSHVLLQSCDFRLLIPPGFAGL